MSATNIARFIIPVAIIYILGLVVPFLLISNVNFGPNNTEVEKIQAYIDDLLVSQPVSF